MKKRIKKTGEIVDVIDYFAPYGTQKDEKDFVCYIDHRGTEQHTKYGMNINLDFEDVEEELSTGIKIDWEQRRYEIAKTAIHARMAGPIIPGVGPNPSVPELTKWAVYIADALITELKKGGQQ